MHHQPSYQRSNLMEMDVGGNYLTDPVTDPSAKKHELRDIYDRLGRLLEPDHWSMWDGDLVRPSVLSHALSQGGAHVETYRSLDPSAELFERDWHAGIDRDFVYLVHFTSAVSTASMFLSAAFQRAAVEDFRPPRPTFHSVRGGRHHWHDVFLKRSFSTFKTLRNALVHNWTPTPDAEAYEQNAFIVLCALTPASKQLLELRSTDRRRASAELVRQLDLIATQVALTSNLEADLLKGKTYESPSDHEAVRRSQQDLLKRAGRGLTLTQAAGKLQVTRQALHKRIKSGTALGVMFDDKLIVPSVQIVETDDGHKIVEHLKSVLGAFQERGSGQWAALQFLIEKDPNLEATPIDVLKEGNHEKAAHAARSYLGIDEG